MSPPDANLPADLSASAPGPRVRPATELQRTIISCYLALFFFVVGSWLLPDSVFPNKWIVTQFTWPIMNTMGWVQCWSLFSPEVREVNVHCNAIITFQDGTTKIYEFPRTQKMDLGTKFVHEKLRKLFIDNMGWKNTSKPFLPSISRYIARANYDGNNPPKTITLLVNMVPMPNPDPKNWKYIDQLPEHTNKEILAIYQVKDIDLMPDNAPDTVPMTPRPTQGK